MHHHDVHRAVARATGESVSRIKRIGFLLAEPQEPIADPQADALGPQVLDWDECNRSEPEGSPADMPPLEPACPLGYCR